MLKTSRRATLKPLVVFIRRKKLFKARKEPGGSIDKATDLVTVGVTSEVSALGTRLATNSIRPIFLQVP